MDNLGRRYGIYCAVKLCERKGEWFVIVAYVKKIGLVAVSVIAFVVALSSASVVYAQDYEDNFPSYVTSSGGAYAEVWTSYGKGTLLFQWEDRENTMGFWGNSGYELYNLSNHSVPVKFFFASPASINGITVDQLWGTFGTYDTLCLSIPVGYYTDGTIRYSPVYTSTTWIYNTNMNFLDASNNRYNNALLFTTDQKLLFLVFVGIILIVVAVIAWRMWRA